VATVLHVKQRIRKHIAAVRLNVTIISLKVTQTDEQRSRYACRKKNCSYTFFFIAIRMAGGGCYYLELV